MKIAVVLGCPASKARIFTFRGSVRMQDDSGNSFNCKVYISKKKTLEEFRESIIGDKKRTAQKLLNPGLSRRKSKTKKRRVKYLDYIIRLIDRKEYKKIELLDSCVEEYVPKASVNHYFLFKIS